MLDELLQNILNVIATGAISSIPAFLVYLIARGQNKNQSEGLRNDAQAMVQKGYQALSDKNDKLEREVAALKEEQAKEKIAHAREQGIAEEKARVDASTITDLTKRVVDLELVNATGVSERAGLLNEIKELKLTIVALTEKVHLLTEQLQASKIELAAEKAKTGLDDPPAQSSEAA